MMKLPRLYLNKRLNLRRHCVPGAARTDDRPTDAVRDRPTDGCIDARARRIPENRTNRNTNLKFDRSNHPAIRLNQTNQAIMSSRRNSGGGGGGGDGAGTATTSGTTTPTKTIEHQYAAYDPHGIGVDGERLAKCRVHKSCSDAYCEFRRLAWELRALRDWQQRTRHGKLTTKTEGGGGVRSSTKRTSRSGPRAIAEAYLLDEEKWNEAAEAERKRLRAEAAKEAKKMEFMARNEKGREKKRRRGPEDARLAKRAVEEEKKARPETPEEMELRLAREVYESRMSRVRTLLQRRAMLLARAQTVVVDADTGRAIRRLSTSEVKKILQLEAAKEADVERERRERGANRKRTPGPDVGDMYELPKLYEEAWLFENANVEEPTDSDLIHMLVNF